MALALALASCKKDDEFTRNDIVGKWSATSIDLTFDGQNLPYSTNKGFFYIWDESFSEISVSNMNLANEILSSSYFIFNDNGSCLMCIEGYEDSEYTWSYEGSNTIRVQGTEYIDDYYILHITDGSFALDGYYDDYESVLGYYYSESEINPDEIDNWSGHDGNTHTIKTMPRFSKAN